MPVLLSLMLVGLGITMLLSPRLFYEITEGWKNNAGGDPSDLYCFSTRLGGVMCLLAGILGLAAWLLR